MINLATNRLVRGVNDDPILKWEVWFRGPSGLHQTLSEAIEFCKARDLDPDLCVFPVAIARSEGTWEEFSR